MKESAEKDTADTRERGHHDAEPYPGAITFAGAGPFWL
jgi:hypothetical protein